MMPINAMKAYIVGGVLAVFFALMAYQWVINVRLELKLSKCETVNAQLSADRVIGRLEVNGLKNVITEQNNAIARYRRDSVDRERKVSDAQDRAAKRKAADLQAIADLASQQGASCAEGIALLDRELKL